MDETAQLKSAIQELLAERARLNEALELRSREEQELERATVGPLHATVAALTKKVVTARVDAAMSEQRALELAIGAGSGGAAWIALQKSLAFGLGFGGLVYLLLSLLMDGP